MISRQTVAVSALVLLTALFLAFYALTIFDPFAARKNSILPEAPASATLTAPTVTVVDPKRGNQHGATTIVLFSDYQCVYCKEMEPILNTALRARPALTLVWKDLPNVTLHPEAQNAALAARCAGRQGKYWEYHDLLFENQNVLSSDIYPRLAEKVGLQLGTFTTCLANKEENAVVLRSVEEATALGVDGTPYFFIGTQRISGQVSAQELADIINAASPLPSRSVPTPVRP